MLKVSAAVIALTALTIGTALAGPAQGDVSVKVSPGMTTEQLAREIASVAADMCAQAEIEGQVDDVATCVVAVVEAVAAESGDNALIAYVQGNEPAIRAAANTN
jgi:acetylornithine deacetylase/succinyl-diaminopimelate desuccinylase-like protein